MQLMVVAILLRPLWFRCILSKGQKASNTSQTFLFLSSPPCLLKRCGQFATLPSGERRWFALPLYLQGPWTTTFPPVEAHSLDDLEIADLISELLRGLLSFRVPCVQHQVKQVQQELERAIWSPTLLMCCPPKNMLLLVVGEPFWFFSLATAFHKIEAEMFARFGCGGRCSKRCGQKPNLGGGNCAMQIRTLTLK